MPRLARKITLEWLAYITFMRDKVVDLVEDVDPSDIQSRKVMFTEYNY